MKLTPRDIMFQWLPLFLYCCVIFIQSSYPSLKIIPKLPHIDKVLHFFAYMILGVLFYRAFRTLPCKDNEFAVRVLSILCASLFALSDEIHQLYVPKRSADYLDFLADVAGILNGVYLYSAAVRNNLFDPFIHGLTKLRTFSKNVLF